MDHIVAYLHQKNVLKEVIFSYKIFLFTYFWLCQVFVAVWAFL